LDYAEESGGAWWAKEFKKPIPEILSFILKHKNSLRELNLTALGKPAADQISMTSELFFELPKLKLESLTVKFDAANVDFASLIALSLNKLTHLHIQETFWTDGRKGSIDAKFELFRVLKKHGSTLETLETRTVAFPFLALEHLKSLEMLDIRTCFPNNIGSLDAPPLPTLAEFTTFILNEDIASLDDLLVSCIKNRFINVEVLTIVLMGEVYTFTKEHLETFLTMEKIATLRIGQHVTAEFLDSCDICGLESVSGALYLGQHEDTLVDSMDTYRYLDLLFDQNRIWKKEVGTGP